MIETNFNYKPLKKTFLALFIPYAKSNLISKCLNKQADAAACNN